MSASKVYFTDMRCKVGVSLLDKLDKLMRAAGIPAPQFRQGRGRPGESPRCRVSTRCSPSREF